MAQIITKRRKSKNVDPIAMPGIKIKNYVVFIRRLSYMLKANVGLVKSLQSLGKSEEDAKLKTKAYALAKRVESGKKLSRAFLEEGFPPVLVDLCKSGENTGDINRMLEEYAKTLEMEHEILQKFKTALIMPKITSTLMFVLFFVMLRVAFPKFREFFDQMSLTPPGLSGFMFAFSDFTSNIFGAIVYFSPLVAMFVLPRVFNINIEKKVLGVIPKLQALYVKQEWIRWCNSVGILIKGNANITEALSASKPLFPQKFANKAGDVSRRVVNGKKLSRSLLEACGSAVPFLIISLIETGEETSKIDEGLLYVAETYGKEVLEETKRLSAIIEPLVTLTMGGFVLLMALSIFMPMIQVWSSVAAQ